VVIVFSRAEESDGAGGVLDLDRGHVWFPKSLDAVHRAMQTSSDVEESGSRRRRGRLRQSLSTWRYTKPQFAPILVA
jgi:hypothetical protein